MQVRTELWDNLNDGTGRKTKPKDTSVHGRSKNSPAGKGEVEFTAIPDLQTLSHMLAREHWFILCHAWSEKVSDKQATGMTSRSCM